MSKTSPAGSVTIGLNAVLAVVDEDKPRCLTIDAGAGFTALPYGPFDPDTHRTFEIGLRDWVERQTNISLGFVEQLYTFGDKGREAPAALIDGGKPEARIVSVGYLALAPERAEVDAPNARWRNWYRYFPWEDWRRGEPASLSGVILPALDAWSSRTDRDDTADETERRKARIRLAFGMTPLGWEEERTLDRYELMYEAGLVEEAWRDRAAAKTDAPGGLRAVTGETGDPMASDHRRILATAIGRLRGKLKYRPVILELVPQTFTLLALQKTVEAIVGFELHKQNFRRSVEKSGMVTKTHVMAQTGAGRPAALFEVSDATRIDRAAKGLTIPRLRLSPGYGV